MKDMKRQSLTKLKSIISNFTKARVLVIGDLILDEFIWGKVERISPEAPVPVVWMDRESFMPGGASNVANSIATLGGEVELVGVIGNDDRGAILKSELDQREIGTSGLVVDKTRPTILKTRVIAHKQQVVRIDKEVTAPISNRLISRLVSIVKNKIDQIDILIIEDYGKGVITSRLLKDIIPLARRKRKVIAVDPKENHFPLYKGVGVITPNHKEASFATGINIVNKKTLEEAGKALLKKLRCNTVLITLGEKGMSLFKEGSRAVHIPTLTQEIFDVSGAGDTVVGVFSLSLASGATSVQAAHIANCAAGIVIGKVGIAVVTQDELIERIKKEING